VRLFGRGRAEVAASVALNHGVGRKQGRPASFGRSGLRSSRFHTIGLKPGLFEEIRGVIWTSSFFRSIYVLCKTGIIEKYCIYFVAANLATVTEHVFH